MIDDHSEKARNDLGDKSNEEVTLVCQLEPETTYSVNAMKLLVHAPIIYTIMFDEHSLLYVCPLTMCVCSIQSTDNPIAGSTQAIRVQARTHHPTCR